MSKSRLPNQALQTDVVLADARNHAAERQVVGQLAVQKSMTSSLIL